MKSIGLSIIITGVVIIIIGLTFMLHDKVPFFGKLPGDISIKGKNTSFFFPVTTCIILSIIISIILNIISKLFK